MISFRKLRHNLQNFYIGCFTKRSVTARVRVTPALSDLDPSLSDTNNTPANQMDGAKITSAYATNTAFVTRADRGSRKACLREALSAVVALEISTLTWTSGSKLPQFPWCRGRISYPSEASTSSVEDTAMVWCGVVRHQSSRPRQSTAPESRRLRFTAKDVPSRNLTES